MEFLNILAATGMPGNVFGVLTHLDLFKSVSSFSISFLAYAKIRYLCQLLGALGL
jgi:hypothetical protein